MSRAESADASKLQSLARELAKNVKSQKDLSDLTSKLVKIILKKKKAPCINARRFLR